MTTNRRASISVLFFLAFGITLTATRAEATPRTWTGATSGNWSTATNWSGNVAPVPGDDLVFPLIASNKTNTNDLGAGTQFQSILIQGDYTISGNAIQLGAGGLTFTVGSSTTATLGLAAR